MSSTAVSASHVAKVLSAAHTRATVEKPKGFGVLHEKTTAAGFQVFTLDDGSVAVAHRIPGDDAPNGGVSANMLLALGAYKPTLKAQGFHGTIERMEQTAYPFIKLTGRDAPAKPTDKSEPAVTAT